MGKWSVAILLLIVSLIGAEDKGADTTSPSPTASAGADDVTGGHHVPASTVNSQVQQPHTIVRDESVSGELEHTVHEEEELDASSEESKAMKSKIVDNTGKLLTDPRTHWEVSMSCLECLCTFATGCALDRGCEVPDSTAGLEDGFEKGDCGPFHISLPFWADANNVAMDTGDAIMEKRWKDCSTDLLCATESIQKYFHKYPHDCNGDGKIDCLDYAAIHTLGPFGCRDVENLNYWNRNRRKGLLECMVKHEEGPYTHKMRELQDKLKIQDIGAWKLAEIEKRKRLEEDKDKTAVNEVKDKTPAKEVKDKTATKKIEDKITATKTFEYKTATKKFEDKTATREVEDKTAAQVEDKTDAQKVKEKIDPVEADA